jgi:hypothetical protein
MGYKSIDYFCAVSEMFSTDGTLEIMKTTKCLYRNYLENRSPVQMLQIQGLSECGMYCVCM